MRTVESEIGSILAGSISEITQRSIFRRLGGMARAPLQQLSAQDRQTVQTELESSVRLFAPGKSAELIAACSRVLALMAGAAGAPRPPLPGGGAAAPATASTLGTAGAESQKRLAIETEKDIASARLEAWSEAVRIGLSKFTSVKVATAVSELARNIIFYAGTGAIELRTRHDAKETRLEIVAADQGPGIDSAKLEAIFAGSFRSERGLGKGLVAVQKLGEDFQIETRPGRGTRVSCVFRGGR
jgi:anti-sigma regulatory factor (Ser/Thr protein kinase)